MLYTIKSFIVYLFGRALYNQQDSIKNVQHVLINPLTTL